MPLKMLILEDDPADADLMVDELRQVGFSLEWQGVETKAEYLAQLHPSLDLILADQTLPQFDGISALKLLKESALDIPFIIVSGSIGEEQAVCAIKVGADDYLMKDRLGRLGSAVGQALKAKALRAQKQQAEQKLRESEEHFRLLAEYAQDIIYRYKLFPSPHLSYISPAVTRIFGYTPEEHYADPELIWKEGHPDDLPVVTAALDAITLGEDAWTANFQQVELRWRGKDGRTIWLEQHSSPIYGDDGVCIAIVGVARDITQRKEIEAERRKLARAVEQSPASIVITDSAGCIEYVNPKFTEITGYTSAEMLGQNPRLLKSGHTTPEEYAHLWQTITAGNEWRGEFHNKAKSGNLYWEAASITPLFNERREITHFLAIKEDIGERKRREHVQESLLASANVLRAATTRSEMVAALLRQIASILEAPQVFFVSCLPESAEMLVEATYNENADGHRVGLHLPTDASVSGRVYRSGVPYVHDSVLDDAAFACPEWVGDNEAVACIPLRTPSETIGVFWVARQMPFSATDVRLLTAIGDMAATGLQRVTLHEGLVLHAANLELEVASRTEELCLANAKLLELDRLKSKFVSNVSHELRNPVASMLLYLELIALKPEKCDQYIPLLREQVQRLKILVEEVLDLSRLENQPLPPMAPVNLNELVAQVVGAQQARAESKALTLAFEPYPELPWTQGNSDKLVQIVTNLVANAVNYTLAGGITVRTFVPQTPDSVSIAVADTGMGIHPDDVPHLFERFYRGKQDGASPVPGTGLGLSIVKELVDLHQGTIEVQSRLGAGTTFTLTFPAAIGGGNSL